MSVSELRSNLIISLRIRSQSGLAKSIIINSSKNISISSGNLIKTAIIVDSLILAEAVFSSASTKKEDFVSICGITNEAFLDPARLMLVFCLPKNCLRA